MKSRDYLLRGDIVKCGSCGYAMSYDDSTAEAVYRCYHTLADPDAECHKQKISASALNNVVLTTIRKQAEAILNSGDLSELRKTGDESRQIANCEKEIRLCIEQRQQAYERFFLHEIDSETYQMLKKSCSTRLDRLNSQINILKQAERDRQAGLKSAAIAKNALSEAASPREIVVTLVDKILVFPDNKLEIHWKIADFTTPDEKN